MSEAPQTIVEPNDDDLARLDEKRGVIRAQLDGEDLRHFDSVEGKLAILQAILQSGVLEAEQTFELQCLGVVLGDAFVEHLDLEWVMVEDEYGRDPAVSLPGTSILVFPMTMISKRVERGETVDAAELFNAVAGHVEKLKAEGC